MSKKRLGRPRSKPPKVSEFARWLKAYMEQRGLSPLNVASGLGVAVETVYGWLAGDAVKNEQMVRGALNAVYPEPKPNMRGLADVPGQPRAALSSGSKGVAEGDPA